jgi:hypothetical protein
METKLRAVGLSVDTSRTYRVPVTEDHPDRVSVFVDARGSTIQVYVENRMVQTIYKVPTSAAAQSHASTSSTVTVTQQQNQQTPSDWVWRPKYKRYYRLIGTTVDWAPS